MTIKITNIDGLKSSTSSSGRWVVSFDFSYPEGLKANAMRFFWYKVDALGFLRTLQVNQEYDSSIIKG